MKDYRKCQCMSFIDYEEDFTIITVLEVFRKPGVEEVYFKTLGDSYKDGKTTIKLHTETDKVPIKKGVRRATLSLQNCLQFAKIERNGKGIKTGEEHLNNIRFADDIVLYSESANKLQLTNDLNRESLEVRLKMNRKKPSIIFNSKVNFKQIREQGELLEEMDEYMYLGQIIQINTAGRGELSDALV